MKLYNTLSRRIEDFIPMSGRQVGLYACGPTVYDYNHIGHLRKYTMDDILIRTLKHEGYDVKFVQNITDVGHLASDGDTGEDKLEKGAKKYNQTVWDIAKKFTKHFKKSMKLMNNIDPDVTAVVTDHIQEQLDLVIKLEKKGFAYEIEGDGIYFDISKFPDYGKMAKLDLDQQKEGVRVDVVAGKRNSADFALWKFEREGENRQMSWKSPWAEKSFPGWHVECSAIGMKYLGEQFDIHTGGIDHIPVHHTNEIAQSEAAMGKSPFVKYWVHQNFLKVDGQKMSKSLGNFYTIDDVIERGFHPLALRLLFLTAHYRSEMNFTWENLAGAQKSYEKLLREIIELEKNSSDDGVIANESLDGLGVSAKKYLEDFFDRLDSDLNTAWGIGVLFRLVKDLEIKNFEKLILLLEFNKILGLGLDGAEEILQEIEVGRDSKVSKLPSEIKQILEDRSLARKNSDWGKSDSLRDLLLEKGYKVLDLPEGQKLEKNSKDFLSLKGSVSYDGVREKFSDKSADKIILDSISAREKVKS